MRLCALVVLSALLVGCVIKDYDYDAAVEPKIVVNSILSPDYTVRIDLWISKKLDGNADFARLAGAHVVLREDGAVILDTQSSGDTTLMFDYYPKPGSTYSIQVDAEGYDPVSASTSVPDAAWFDCSYVRTVEGSRSDNSFDYYHIGSASIPVNAHSLWIATDDVPEQSFFSLPEQYRRNTNFLGKKEIYTTAPFADQFNCQEDSNLAAYKGSSKNFCDYVRVPANNIGMVFPITFSTRMTSADVVLYPDDYYDYLGYDDKGNYGNSKYPDESLPIIKLSARVSLIATSKEYDLYYKSLYRYTDSQYIEGKSIKIDEEHYFMVDPRRYPVYSNVKNGIGVVAAYNGRCNKFFDIR